MSFQSLKHWLDGGGSSVAESFQITSSQTEGHNFFEKLLSLAYNCVWQVSPKLILKI